MEQMWVNKMTFSWNAWNVNWQIISQKVTRMRISRLATLNELVNVGIKNRCCSAWQKEVQLKIMCLPLSGQTPNSIFTKGLSLSMTQSLVPTANLQKNIKDRGACWECYQQIPDCRRVHDSKEPDFPTDNGTEKKKSRKGVYRIKEA